MAKTQDADAQSMAPGGSTEGQQTHSITVDGRTVAHAYLRRVEVSPDQRLYLVKRKGKYFAISWREAHARVLGIFQGLEKAGIRPGDSVCISSQSRPEWSMADLAIMTSGAVTVPIYHSSTVEDVAFILENCDAKLIFAEDEGQCRKLADALKLRGVSVPLVIFADSAPSIPGQTITTFEEFAQPTSDPQVQKRLEASADAVDPEATASIVYTSGTTGRPKGVVLSHLNFMAELRGITAVVAFSNRDLTVTFLPFAHILGRVESLMPIVAGITLGFAESINSVSLNIQEIKPTMLVSVPRIYEKIYAKIQSDVATQSELKRNLFQWSVNIGRSVARLRSENASVPLPLQLKYRIADRLVFTKIRAKLGGNIRVTVSGGAPLSAELCELFHACGVKVLEGYGLTETSAAVSANRLESYGFGTVGKPFGGTELRIAEDGEIQLRGPIIFKQYHRDPQATAEVFTKDGWFCTGDIGTITPRGFLKITDRKKELIVTSGGKNIAPQKIENMLKGSRFVSNGLVYGDKQKYLVALVTLNEPEVRTWAQTQGINGNELTRQEKVRTLIEAEIKQVNIQLASYESIKRFHILPSDFTVESGELTPSLKLKRKILCEKYKQEITGLYQG